MRPWIRRLQIQKSNFFKVWTHQKIEQVCEYTVPLLPAPETFQNNEFLMNLCKNLKICMRPWIRRLQIQKSNFFKVWTHQKIEQVCEYTVPLLPAPETFQNNEFLMNLCKKLKICMRPWIRRYAITSNYYTFPPVVVGRRRSSSVVVGPTLISVRSMEDYRFDQWRVITTRIRGARDCVDY